MGKTRFEFTSQVSCLKMHLLSFKLEGNSHFLLNLHRLCWERLGWEKQKADELLVPVLKEYSKHEVSASIRTLFFKSSWCCE